MSRVPQAPFRSTLAGQAWPAALSGPAAETLALVHQLEASQWWDAERLRDAQFGQLHVLLSHAAAHVPFHRARLLAAGFDPAEKLSEAVWSRIPVLTRRDVQAHAARLHATIVPPEHGTISERASGGSTGVPVRVRVTAAQTMVQGAALCRDHAWHNDMGAGSAQIRSIHYAPSAEAFAEADSAEGVSQPSHGPPYDWVFETGPRHFLNYRRSPEEQAVFLLRTRPAHLNVLPSTLRLLLLHLRERGVAIPSLRVISCTSETVDDALRALCREVLGCRITALYSANETGFMAGECPEHEHYHVCAETCLLEVLDEVGRPCAPGETGRVIVTPLHNLAMPLIRYEIGDLAVPGLPCACGRGLPVLSRVTGRSYDALTLADGSKRTLGAPYELAGLAAVREFQFVQRVAGTVEVHLVASRALTGEEERVMREAMRVRTGPDLGVSIVYRDQLPRTAAGKLRLFVSELA